MPFIEVKMWKGRTPDQKKTLIEKLTQATCDSVGCPKDAVSIVIEDVDKENWGKAGIPASEQ